MKNTLYCINERSYTCLHPLKEELTFLNEPLGFRLDYLTVIQVTGDKALDFLQGQLTCDVRLVNPGIQQQGALCNLKGRVLALVDVFQWEGLYHLLLPTDLLAQTLTSLQAAAQLSRIVITPLPALHLYGIYHPTPMENVPCVPHQILSTPTHCCYALTAQRAIYISQIPIDWTITHKGSLAWHFLALHDKTMEIYPDTRGLFLAHRLDLHLSGAIHFNKGCYKGQEIIARTHYRGTLKHSLVLRRIGLESPPQSGTFLTDPQSKKQQGEVIDYCPDKEKGYYWVLLSERLDAAIADL